MLINLPKFKEVLKKATCSYVIDSVLLNVTPKKITTSMKSNTKDVFVILDMDNEVFSEAKEEFMLSFAEPKTNVEPFLNSLDVDEATIKLKENMIIVDGKVKLTFEDPSVVSTFEGKGVQDSVDFFTEFDITDEIMDDLEKIKKIGSRFGKVYFVVEEGKLYVEATDRTNSFSNSLKFFISDVKMDDVVICFNYKNYVSLMNVLNGHYAEYKIKLCWFEQQELGGLYCEKVDEQEKYFLTSMKDD